MPPVYKALLIGNSEFTDDPHNLPALKGPVNDPALLLDALIDRELGLFDPADVRLLPERSKRDIVTSMEQFFSGAARDHQLLLYYSGHGLKDINDNLYLCARDTITTSLVATAISDSEINAMINLSAARAVVIVLDCCYSGAFKGGDLTATLKGEGRFVITSCRRSQLSSDAELETGASPFTAQLVESLRLGTLDGDGDGFVEVNDVYDYVLERLRPTGQLPQRHFDNAVGDVLLARARQAAAPVPPPAAPGRPVLAVSSSEINLTDVGPEEILPTEIVDVFNLGDGELDWTVDCDADWVRLEPQAGCFRITMRPRPGVNRATVHVRDRGRGGARTVRLNVRVLALEPPPHLELSEDEIDLGTLSRGAVSPLRTVRLRNVGGGQLDARASTGDPWIELRQLGDVLQLRVDTAVIGVLRGEVRVTSAAGQATIRVRARIVAGPVLAVAPAVIDFGRVAAGARPVRLLRVDNHGSGDLEWTYGCGADLLGAERVPQGLELRLLGGRHGRHQGSVWIRSNGGDVSVDVRAEVAEAAPPAVAPPPAPAGRAGGGPGGRRRRPAWPVLAAVLLAAVAAAAAGVAIAARRPPTPPADLRRMVADFRPHGFTPRGFEGEIRLERLKDFFGKDSDRLRPLLERRGFRRGFVQGWSATNYELLGVTVIELGSAADARSAEREIGVCIGTAAASAFEVPGVGGASGRRCLDGNGKPVQEVVFSRGPRSYRVKLEKVRQPESTSEITTLAQAEAAAAR